MIQIRFAKKENLDEVLELENKIWPPGTRAPREKFESRLKIFAKGFILAYKDGSLIGASTSQIINYDRSTINSWENVTDNGWIRNHNPKGNALYVVSIGSISRIAGYDAYCREQGEIPIEGYIKLLRGNGELLDPELRFYTRNGLSLQSIKPNYMEDDKESRNYGAIM